MNRSLKFSTSVTAPAVAVKQRVGIPALPGRQQPAGPMKWQVDRQGTIVNFTMKALRDDILYRLESGSQLYTTEECKVFLMHMVRQATQWQEEELASLQYLAQMHAKVLPGKEMVYQWPPSAAPVVPFATPVDILNDTPTYRVTKVVEELNRSLVRMIDKLWNDRRERLLLAARILRDLEPLVQQHQQQ
jgi:hypothetical protein